MSDAANAAIATAAWLAAGSLSVAVGAVVFGVMAHQRSRVAESRLHQLQVAVGDFTDALRARLSLELGRPSSEQRGRQAEKAERVA